MSTLSTMVHTFALNFASWFNDDTPLNQLSGSDTGRCSEQKLHSLGLLLNELIKFV